MPATVTKSVFQVTPKQIWQFIADELLLNTSGKSQRITTTEYQGYRDYGIARTSFTSLSQALLPFIWQMINSLASKIEYIQYANKFAV